MYINFLYIYSEINFNTFYIRSHIKFLKFHGQITIYRNCFYGCLHAQFAVFFISKFVCVQVTWFFSFISLATSRFPLFLFPLVGSVIRLFLINTRVITRYLINTRTARTAFGYVLPICMPLLIATICLLSISNMPRHRKLMSILVHYVFHLLTILLTYLLFQRSLEQQIASSPYCSMLDLSNCRRGRGR